MSMTNKRVIKTLNRLYKIGDAGEKGFEVVAENVSNRGLKVLLKTYAQQRAQFAAELRAEIQRLGGKVTESRSVRGIIHRGRIDIRGALTIGPENVENVVLAEAELGEKAAVKTYQNALREELPAATRAIVERQYEQIQAVSNQVERLREHSGKRLVVRLFDSDRDVEMAMQALKRAGFTEDTIETIALNQVINTYQGDVKRSKLDETILSGAFGGAIWGSLLGATAGAGVLFIPGLEPFWTTSIQGTWAIIALGGTLIGALFGALLGFLIGVSISQEDSYLYDDSIQYGNTLVRVQTDGKRASEASQIMYQVNAASRARARHVS